MSTCITNHSVCFVMFGKMFMLMYLCLNTFQPHLAMSVYFSDVPAVF